MQHHHLSCVIDCSWSGSVMTFTLQYLLFFSFLSHTFLPSSFLFHPLPSSVFSSPFISSPSRPVDSAETSRSPFCNTEKQRLISPTQPRLRREEEEEDEKEDEEARRSLLTATNQTRKYTQSPLAQLLYNTTLSFLGFFSLNLSLILLPPSSPSLHLYFPWSICPSVLQFPLISSPHVFLTLFDVLSLHLSSPLCAFSTVDYSISLFTVFIVFHFGSAPLHWQTNIGC